MASLHYSNDAGGADLVADVVSISDFRPSQLGAAQAGVTNIVVFNRSEFDLILQTYGRKVVAGEWRDYALEFAPEQASFAIIRNAGRGAEFRVVKWPRDCGAGCYAIVSQAGQVLRRGAHLGEVLKLFDCWLRLL